MIATAFLKPVSCVRKNLKALMLIIARIFFRHLKMKSRQTLSLGQKKHVRARVTINGTRYRLHDDASVTINSKENVPWVILASSHRHTLVYECFMRAYSASQRTFGTQDSIPEELAGFIDNTVRDPDQHKIFEQICSSFE
jgi:hypothetical protein